MDFPVSLTGVLRRRVAHDQTLVLHGKAQTSPSGTDLSAQEF